MMTNYTLKSGKILKYLINIVPILPRSKFQREKMLECPHKETPQVSI